MISNYNKRVDYLRLGSLDYSKNKNSLWRFKIFKDFESYSRLDQVEANIKHINSLAINDKRYRPFSKFYNYYWNLYKVDLIEFNKSYQDSTNLLSKTIPIVEDNLSLKRVKELVREKSADLSNNWIIIGDDHSISHSTIMELVSKKNTHTAIAVIDNHADIYGPAQAKNNPLKFNPFRNLIELGLVNHVFFFCPSFKELLDDQKVWKDIADNISFVPLTRSSRYETKFSSRNFKTILEHTLRRKSIERIFFSIDIDALSNHPKGVIYSAFEYSVLNSILYLSLLSHKQIQDYSCLSTAIVSLDKRSKINTKIRIRNPYKPGLNIVNEIGMTPSGYCDAIRGIYKISKKMGLKIGLGSCIGEVVELMGPDWRGETTKATIKIINCLGMLK